MMKYQASECSENLQVQFKVIESLPQHILGDTKNDVPHNLSHVDRRLLLMTRRAIVY